MRWVVWDWNGTLLDDVSACLAIMDGMLVRRSLAPIGSLARYREIFTFPVKDYYALAGLDVSGDCFLALADEYMDAYRAAEPACGLMPGAEAVLRTLGGMGMAQVLVSASRQDDLERQVDRLGLTGTFRALLGVSDQLGGGKAGVAAGYLTREHIDPMDVLFVGDTLHDWQIARQLHGRCVLIAAGHQSRTRLESAGVPVLEDISQLPALLAGEIGGGHDGTIQR